MTTIEDRAKDTIAPAKKNPNIEYIVLAKDTSGYWHTDGKHVSGRSAKEAIRTYSGKESGVYVAIPMRSWNPVKVSVETVSRVKLEEA